MYVLTVISTHVSSHAPTHSTFMPILRDGISLELSLRVLTELVELATSSLCEVIMNCYFQMTAKEQYVSNKNMLNFCLYFFFVWNVFPLSMDWAIIQTRVYRANLQVSCSMSAKRKPQACV